MPVKKIPLSPAGLTHTKKLETLYPTQLGVKGEWPEYVLTTNKNVLASMDRNWGWGKTYAHRRIAAAEPKVEALKKLFPKAGDYAWVWNSKRSMSAESVGRVVSADYKPVFGIVTDAHKVVETRQLIKITKKQYLEVLSKTKIRKVLRRITR